MNAAIVIVKKLIGLLLGILTFIKHLYRRVVCRSGHGRKMSGSLLPFTTDQITPVGEIQQSLPSNNVSELHNFFRGLETVYFSMQVHALLVVSVFLLARD